MQPTLEHGLWWLPILILNEALWVPIDIISLSLVHAEILIYPINNTISGRFKNFKSGRYNGLVMIDIDK